MLTAAIQDGKGPEGDKMAVMNNALTCIVLAALCVIAQPSAAHSAMQELDFGEYGVLGIDLPEEFVWEHTYQKLGYAYRSQFSDKEILTISLLATKPVELFDMPDEEFLERLNESIYPDGMPSGFMVEHLPGNRSAIVVIADVTKATESIEFPAELSGWIIWITMMFYDKAFEVMVAVPDDPERARDRFLNIMWDAEHWIAQ